MFYLHFCGIVEGDIFNIFLIDCIVSPIWTWNNAIINQDDLLCDPIHRLQSALQGTQEMQMLHIKNNIMRLTGDGFFWWVSIQS